MFRSLVQQALATALGRKAKEFNQWGGASMQAIGGALVLLSIAVYILAAVLPGAITSLFAADTTTWSTSARSLWPVLAILIIAAVIFMIYKSSMRDPGQG